MTTTKRASAEEQVAAATAPETFYYVFDLAAMPNPLIRFSVASDYQMGADPTSFLQHYRYEAIPGGNDLVHYYESKDWADCQYLAVVEVAGRRFVFHIKNDASLRLWRETYEQHSFMLDRMPGLLPEPAKDAYAGHTVLRLNPLAIRHGDTNGYY